MRLQSVTPAVLFVFVAIFISNANSKLRSRRFLKMPSPEQTIRVIANTSIPCVAANPSIRRRMLTQDDMRYIFEQQGGEFVSKFMAVDREQAKRDFPSLLDVGLPLKTHANEIEAEGEVEAEGSSIGVKDNESVRDILVNYLEQFIQAQREKEMSRSNVHTGNSRSRQSHHARSRTDENILKKNKDGTISTDQTKGHSERRARIVSPEQIGLQPRYVEKSGAIVHTEGCIMRGTEDADGNINMCTTCQTTTQHPEGKWPQQINEALCSLEDPGCLVVDGTEYPGVETRAHGNCIQTILPMNMMCRRAGQCMLALENGQTILVEEWEICPGSIRVGCECFVKATSIFSNFV